MTGAALAFGISGTALAVLSLGWQFYTFRAQGARPKLTPIIGTNYGGGALLIDATAEVRPSLLALEAQLDADPADRIVGVTVVNKGRADLTVTRWSFRAVPAGTVFLPPDVPGCPSVPCNIPPGGEETFFTTLNRVRFVATASEAVGGGRPQRVVATVTSGGRTYVSKPIATANLELDRP